MNTVILRSLPDLLGLDHVLHVNTQLNLQALPGMIYLDSHSFYAGKYKQHPTGRSYAHQGGTDYLQLPADPSNASGLFLSSLEDTTFNSLLQGVKSVTVPPPPPVPFPTMPASTWTVVSIDRQKYEATVMTSSQRLLLIFSPSYGTGNSFYWLSVGSNIASISSLTGLIGTKILPNPAAIVPNGPVTSGAALTTLGSGWRMIADAPPLVFQGMNALMDRNAEPACQCESRALATVGHDKHCAYIQWKRSKA